MTALTSRRSRVSGKVIDAHTLFAPTGVKSTGFTSQALADLEAERALISAVLQQPELFPAVTTIIEAGDFWRLMHGFIWFAFGRLQESRQPIDVLSVARQLDAEPHAPVRGDAALDELTRLYGAAPRAEHIEYYARRVRDAATKLRLLEATVEMQKLVFDKTTDGMTEMLVDSCNRLLFQASDQRLGLEDTHVTAAIRDYQSDLERSANEREIPGLVTGWPKWDDPVSATGGLYPGELTVIAGKEGLGKTTWLLSLLRNVLKAGARVALFSLEMRRDEIVPVFASMESGISKARLRARRLNSLEWPAFHAAAQTIADWNLHLIDEFRSVSNPLTPRSLQRKLRFMLSRQPLDLIAIDGLWLMQHENERMPRQQQVGEIVAQLVDIAKGECGARFPVIITHQYNSDVGKRVKKPSLYHLAESAGVRRNAQVIVGLWRSEDSRFMEAHLLKDRSVGNTGYSGYFRYEPSRSLYEETL